MPEQVVNKTEQIALLRFPEIAIALSLLFPA
jgi:hypothetical protein